ncbi:putative F-box protein At1g44080 [Apium graveolens]|uniref:putative F-box protein At1g44080 n=1 Tax=Apium graveolens TaxID=4045 RepID=UPI003D7934DF
MVIPCKSASSSAPLLVLPTHDDYNKQCHLYSHDGSKISHANMCGNNDGSSRCVGSSKGWLILHHSNDQDCESSLSLFSPVCGSTKKIVLPSLNWPSGFEISWITKSILTSCPAMPDHKFGVVFLYGVCDYKVALLSMHGVGDDENKWIELKCSPGEKYVDVISHQDYLFALLTSGSIDVWNLRSDQDGGSIGEKMKIKTWYIEPVVEFGEKFRDLYTGQSYLVKSQGNLLLVFRIIGEFVKEDGEVVNEGALLDDEEYSHLVLPYKTKNFYVYKLDNELKKWEKIDSLEDGILFVGLNESMSLSAVSNEGCPGGCIYFTDDNWDHINIHEHDLYGGHDMGIFNLRDKSVKEIFQVRRMVPPPVWIDQDIATF